MPLTIDRLFGSPALSGPTLQSIQVAPVGSRITYLRGKDGLSTRLDLWEYDLHARKARVLINCDTIIAAGADLSEEEKARRERQRMAGLSGILEYDFSPTGQALVFGCGGNLYYAALDAGKEPVPVQLTGAGETDAQISPCGSHVAYVRQQNLFVHDLSGASERQLTSDGGGAIKNAMAEFIAQEEMDRHSGFWWSPDDAHIAFARIDESGVTVHQRLEIGAHDTLTVEQRYPAAGEPNARVRLGVVDVRTAAIRWMDLGPDTDIYLARVAWLPDGRTLAVQRQSRDQRRLDLLFIDIGSGQSRRVLSESSNTWIDLHDELTFLKSQAEFIWASGCDGFRHLYLYSTDGTLLRRLTQGEWVVDDFRGRAIKAVDEARRLVYFTATAGDATQRHLYAASLDTQDPGNPRRISAQPGVHAVTMPSTPRFYIDQFSGPAQPAQAALRDIDGSLIAYLSENRLDAAHPYADCLAEESAAEYGELQAEDGQCLQYRLFKPHALDRSRRYPAILDVYGGPGVQRVLKNWTGATFTQVMTRAGYFVLQLDNRGSAFRGDRFQAPIHGKLGEIEVQDQLLGARWLARQPQVDAARIGVWGWSYGGYLTLMLMFKAPEVFRAGVAGAPVTDWALYDTHYTERYLGTPQENPDGYAASSVLPHAHGLRGALLLMHGMADDNVLFTHSTRLYRRLQDLGKPFDIMAYPGGKHGLTRTGEGRHAYMTIKRYFDEHL